MTETATYTTLRYGAKVTTPLGPGIVIGRMDEPEEMYLVCFSRNDFTPEQWMSLCPVCAPCTYKQYKREDLQ